MSPNISSNAINQPSANVAAPSNIADTGPELSTGAKVAIGVTTSAAVIVLVGLLAFLLLQRHRRKNKI